MVAWIMVVVECKDSHFAQGFASGDMDRDAAALRLFVDEGHTVLLAQVRSSPTEALSFSKTRLISATLCRSNSINAIDVTRVKSQMSDVKYLMSMLLLCASLLMRVTLSYWLRLALL